MMTRNIPYVKSYDPNGVLINPIVGLYESGKSMRSWKRSYGKKTKTNNRQSTLGRIIQSIPIIREEKDKKTGAMMAIFEGKFKFVRHIIFFQPS